MNRHKVTVAATGLASLILMAIAAPCRTVSAAAKPEATADAALVNAMEAELQRAMTSFGKTASDAQPKPYFLSYAVSDSDIIGIAAEFGAITASHERRRRPADVQLRIGTPAEDNTHGDHRNSAITTVPLPLTDDSDAIERSLWFATNRGYGKALDGYLQVKTEQQVRAKEDDASPDFSSEKPVMALLPAAPPLAVDRPAWAAPRAGCERSPPNRWSSSC